MMCLTHPPKRSCFIQLSKEALRRQFREKCRCISNAYRQEAAQTAANHLAKQVFFQESHHIACYFSYKNEFDTNDIINVIWQHNKKCYLPVVTETKLLNFMSYAKGDSLTLNHYAISEPMHKTEIATEQLDLVLLPLAAFDGEGHRLGAGGGYYDRTFAFLSKSNQQRYPLKKPWLIGVAYAQQEASFIPTDSWDIFLDGIITEKECRLFK